MKHKLLFKIFTFLALITLPIMAGTISGVVQTNDTEPIPGATVYAYSTGSTDSTYNITTTDDDGHFTFENLSAATYFLSASTNEGNWGSTEPVALGADEIINNVIIEVYQEEKGTASISGSVVDLDGNPVEYAYVYANQNSIDSSIAYYNYYTETDSEGNYNLKELLAGSYKITVEYYGEFGSARAEYKNTIELENGETVENINITLDISTPKWASISGKIKMNDGTPLEGAMVFTIPNSYDVDSLSYPYINNAYGDTLGNFTDTEGHFVLEKIIPGSYKLQIIHPNGISILHNEVYELVDNQNLENIEIILNAADFAFGTLSGNVITASGLPLADVDVMVQNINSTVYLKTDSEGNYTSDKLSPGIYDIHSYHQIGGYKYLQNSIEVIGNETVIADNIVYADEDIAAGFVTGFVKYDNGDAIEYAYVEFKNDNADYKYGYAQTDETGKFKAILAPGEYYVSCSLNDSLNFGFQYYPNTNNLENAEKISVTANHTVENINFDFAKPEILTEFVISGTVTDENGNPIENARLDYFFNLFDYNYVMGFDSVNTDDSPILTDVNGNYTIRLENVQTLNTKVIISASAEGFISEYWNDKQEYYLADEIIPENSDPLENIDFALKALPGVTGNVFSGTVTDDTGLPIPGVEVIGFHTQLDMMTTTKTDETGQYELQELLEGQYILFFSAMNYIPEYYNDQIYWENSTKLNSNESRSGLDAVLSEYNYADFDSTAYLVVGTVADEKEVLIGGVYVAITDENNEILGYDFTDKNGSFKITGMNIGTLKISASKVNYEVAEGNVDCSNEMVKTHVQNMVIRKVTSPTEIDENNTNVVADKIALHNNFPNPFNPETNISYEINDKATVRLEIYSILGTRVATLVNKNQAAGKYNVVWNAETSTGKKLNSGIYFTRLIVKMGNGKSVVRTNRMVLMK